MRLCVIYFNNFKMALTYLTAHVNFIRAILTQDGGGGAPNKLSTKRVNQSIKYIRNQD